MPARLSDEERQHIIDLLSTGKGCNEIAKEVGRCSDTVSRIARAHGHVWPEGAGNMKLARAHEMRKAYSAEWRADFAKRLAAKCDDLLKEMDAECIVYSFGGKENTYAEHVLKSPPHADRLKLTQAIRLNVQSILDIARHDTDGGMGLPAVDEWLATVRGTKT